MSMWTLARDLATEVDTRWLLWIHPSRPRPFLDTLMVSVADPWPFAPLALVLALYLGTRRGRAGRVVLCTAIAAVFLSDSCGWALKELVQRPRPCRVIAGLRPLVACSESFSFPSNHAINMWALATVFSLWLPKPAPAFFALAGLVAYSRIYLGVHYPSDVLAGAACGVAIGWAVDRFSRLFLKAAAHRSGKEPAGEEGRPAMIRPTRRGK